MKAIIYARVSTQDQNADGSSLESQVKACVDHADKLGYTVVRTVKEVFSGAYLFDRPLLNEVRDDVRTGKIDAVIIYALDRLSRNVAHLHIIKEEFDRFATSLVFASEDFDNSAEGKLLQSVKGYVAEVEREKIRERTMRGRRTKAVNGTISHRRKMYGYQIDEVTGRRVLCPVESHIVREMFETMLSGGSLRKIADDLTRRGIPTPQGNSQWYARSVAHILSNPGYAGRTTLFRFTQKRWYENGGRKLYNGIRTPLQDHVVLSDTTPAIVTVDEFDAVQLIIKNNRTNVRRKATKQYLLRGMVTCGTCGRQFSPGGPVKFRAYVCTSKQSRTANCGTKMLGADKAESTVWSLIADMIRQPDKLREMIEDTTRREDDRRSQIDTQLAAVNRTIQKVETEMRNIVKRSATADDDTWKLFEEQLTAKRRELNRMTEMRDNLLRDRHAAAIPTDDLDSLLKRFARSVDQMTFSDRVTVLKALGLQCTWDGTKLKANIYVQHGCKSYDKRLNNKVVIKLDP
jgi:site-specific DNA recombinase